MLARAGPCRGSTGIHRAPVRCLVPARPSTGCLVAGQRGALVAISPLAVRSRPGDAGGPLDDTQQTLAKVLDLVNSVQRAQASAPLDPNSAREQLLWERQAALHDKLMEQWEAERQAWQAREASLQQQVAGLQQQLIHLLWQQQQQSAAAPQQQQLGGGGPGVTLLSGASAAPLPAPTGESSSRDARATGAGAAAASGFGYSVEDPSPPATPRAASPTPPDSRRAARSEARRRAAADPAAGGAAASWAELFPASSAASSVDAADGAGDGAGSEGSTATSRPAAGAGQQLPRFAQDIAAAIALVDGGDVLTDDLDLGGLRQRRDKAAPAPAPAAPATPAAAAAPPPPPPAAAQQASSSGGGAETARGAPEGPPPLLSVGDDDIYWIAKLHSALEAVGCYPPEEEQEDFLFGEGTAAALLSFQACNGLAETGIADEDTWRGLLGDAAFESAQPPAAAASSNGSGGGGSGSDASASDTADEALSRVAAPGGAPRGAAAPRAKWPVVMDMDGGREVHALHVALHRAGFFCGDDDMRWWMFGEPTMNALRTYQASAGLPESGVCDERTWLALLGPDAKPDDIDALRAEESEYEDDMAEDKADGSVWLLGEQRWSRPV
ncbi:hypothetical protein Rsub_05356 [Raphidocelis subcapitata]|uniref:Peptidoglycan binding-like domain-containing protein n=1 Tax=Raphidocelis subcapitata TaxID=307507 RepID=A0A2V0P342_9CHLO|nr:hypothetical protein Rsub_05356 [Raphidocelis subcapitata]|eukprot:GBF92273.1 hypothetical protein Rsub_05356 [Raphidocelis subcapitata]